MALVQLTDVVIPEVYFDYMNVDDLQKSQFVQSGILVRDPEMDAQLALGGRTGNIPFWNDLDPTAEANYSDDSENSATPAKITAGTMKYRKAFLNYALKDADLTRELAGSDPMQRIRSRFSRWWMWQLQERLIRSCIGVYADNVANDSSDMVNDVTGAATIGAITSDQVFNRENFIDTVMTMGDRFDETKTIMMHSMVYAQLLKNDVAEDVYDSQGSLVKRTYMGHDVIIEDNATLVTAAGGSSPTDTPPYYISIVFGQGAFAYGQNFPAVPVETQREALEGLGGGTEVIVERQNFIIHPYGFDFESSSISGESASWAELDNAAEWNRKIARKNIPLAYLRTHG